MSSLHCVGPNNREQQNSVPHLITLALTISWPISILAHANKHSLTQAHMSSGMVLPSVGGMASLMISCGTTVAMPDRKWSQVSFPVKKPGWGPLGERTAGGRSHRRRGLGRRKGWEGCCTCNTARKLVTGQEWQEASMRPSPQHSLGRRKKQDLGKELGGRSLRLL